MNTSTTDSKNEVASPEFVHLLQGCYDNFLSGRRYYISGGRVKEFIAADLLQSYGKIYPHLEKKSLRFGFYPDFPNHFLSQLQYK